MPTQKTPLDQLLIGFGQALTTLFGQPPSTGRVDPAQSVEEPSLSDAERLLSGALMRVNHTGEVCAQALYQGQALTARNPELRLAMQSASDEENDHLLWTAARVRALNTHTSYLNPLWYGGSFALGALAGLAGDRWSLGFLAETERQVVSHLEGHLNRLPEHDGPSRAVLEVMKQDEARHATTAVEAGARELPLAAKKLMQLGSRVMPKTAFYI